MVRKGAGRVTAADIANAEGALPGLIAQLVKRAKDGSQETKESAAMMIGSLAAQDHGKHCKALFCAGIVRPLVNILSIGSVKAQEASARALHAIAHNQPEHQRAIFDAGAVAPLVKLLSAGSPKLQEEVSGPALLPFENP